jgi:CRP-like cAMP-binding protein
MHLQESKRVLRQSDLFSDLNEIHLDLVLMVCEEINYVAGELIFQQGEPGDAIYIIARGDVDIFLQSEDAGKEQYVTTLGAESTFGEVILVEESRRTASARGKSNAQLIRIPRSRLLKLCQDYPEIGFHIMYRIAAELARKLHSSNVNIREQLFPKIGVEPTATNTATAGAAGT